MDKQLAQIDNATLLVALRSVHESINRYLALMESETLTDRENIQELFQKYNEAFLVLSDAYIKQLETDADLPPYAEVIADSKKVSMSNTGDAPK